MRRALRGHAEVRCAAHQRKKARHRDVACLARRGCKLEHLCRYITRPAVANERLTLNRAGQMVLTLKTPYRDGTTPIVMSPLEFMQRLAALVPRPRFHLIRFHGVLAPNAKHRAEIIPSAPVNTTDNSADHGDAPPHSAPTRIRWARLLKRVFAIDMEHCPHCGGPLTIIAAIVDPTVIAKILTHLGWSARAPPRSPARHFALIQTA
jgi:hypothetical protein